jgi:hypothetical protein
MRGAGAIDVKYIARHFHRHQYHHLAVDFHSLEFDGLSAGQLDGHHM